LPGIAEDESIVIKITLPQVSVLGEMQDQWVRFTAAIVSYKDYLLSDYLPEKVKLLGKQIVRQEEYIIELKHQQKLTEEDLLLTVNSYKRDSILFHNSNYSISINEFERSRQALLQKKVAYSTLVSSIRNTESSALKLRESRLDLNNQYDKEISRYKSEISASTELLKSALGGWKERYLIESPVTGTLSYTTFWRENQVINAGEALATVVPDDPAKMIIRAYVPVSGAGKVKPGQMVNISLSGYPDMEYGLLKGKVTTLSLVPVKDAYIADIELTNGMRTTYNQELVFINDMTGRAGIITEESRLIFRLIKPLRSFFSK
jgi:multidrug resistance efflux pump